MFIADTNTDIAKFYNKAVKWFQKEGGSFLSFNEYWRENLFERIMRLFVYSGMDESISDIMPKEIEQRLLINGSCGVALFRDPRFENTEPEITAFFGNFYGVGKYMDEKPNYMLRCPVWSGEGVVWHSGDEVRENSCVVISNNAVRNAALPLVNHYAYLLAHTEVTLSKSLIIARDAGGVPTASSEKMKQSITDYQKKMYNGEDGVIVDFGMLGVEYAGADRHTSQDIANIMDVRQRLLKNFYADIGVRSSFEKRSNATVNEVEADTSMLLLNISDMLDSRQKGVALVNELFGTAWAVDVAPEIKEQMEIERERSGEDASEDINTLSTE